KKGEKENPRAHPRVGRVGSRVSLEKSGGIGGRRDVFWWVAQLGTHPNFRKWKDIQLQCRSRMGNTMPNDSHQRAAEFHELAAHAHRAAAASHGKGDHQSGHEHSKQAMEHANKAFEWSQEAHRKSANAAGLP